MGGLDGGRRTQGGARRSSHRSPPPGPRPPATAPKPCGPAAAPGLSLEPKREPPAANTRTPADELRQQTDRGVAGAPSTAAHAALPGGGGGGLVSRPLIFGRPRTCRLLAQPPSVSDFGGGGASGPTCGTDAAIGPKGGSNRSPSVGRGGGSRWARPSSAAVVAQAIVPWHGARYTPP